MRLRSGHALVQYCAACYVGRATLFTYPHFNPVALDLGFAQIRWYGLAYIAGFVIGWIGCRIRARRPTSPISSAQVDDLVFYLMLGVIVGGRVGYMLLYNLSGLIHDPLSLFRIWEGGMSFHGGLIGVLLASWYFARRIGQPYLAVTDFMVVWVPPGLGFGRIGNFINNELWGKPTSPDAPWAVIVDGQARQPSQLYEAFLEGLVLFVILWTFTRRERPRASVSGLFLLCYGTFRCAVEFVRVPDNGVYLAFGWLTKGQVYSVPMIVAGAVLLYVAYSRNRRAAGR